MAIVKVRWVNLARSPYSRRKTDIHSGVGDHPSLYARFCDSGHVLSKRKGGISEPNILPISEITVN